MKGQRTRIHGWNFLTVAWLWPSARIIQSSPSIRSAACGYSAVSRKSEDGSKEYFPAQKLTIDQALAAYTTGSAFAEFAEKEKGTLAPGMLADFVILDRDLTAGPSAVILGTKVLRTVVGGKTVYQAK